MYITLIFDVIITLIFDVIITLIFDVIIASNIRQRCFIQMKHLQLHGYLYIHVINH